MFPLTLLLLKYSLLVYPLTLQLPYKTIFSFYQIEFTLKKLKLNLLLVPS